MFYFKLYLLSVLLELLWCLSDASFCKWFGYNKDRSDLVILFLAMSSTIVFVPISFIFYYISENHFSQPLFKERKFWWKK